MFASNYVFQSGGMRLYDNTVIKTISLIYNFICYKGLTILRICGFYLYNKNVMNFLENGY